MVNSPFIGRKNEIKTLGRLLEKRTASLAVVQGRRRIGKSRLIQEFAKGYRFLHFSGIPPHAQTTAESELQEFARQLSEQTDLPEIFANDWSKLFILLSKETSHGRVIILFDEISWMGSKDPDFLGKLKNAWDIYFKKNPELILVLCGSVSTWIEKNILSSTGFLGRISYTLTLEELPLIDCNQFWHEKSFFTSSYEKLKLLSITGGIPSYLELINPNQSAEENIRDLCFIRGGPLVKEFTYIFSDLFSQRSSIYKSIIETLALGTKEIKEIATTVDLSQSGTLSHYLDDLILSGFISRDYTWNINSGEFSKFSHFRLSDNYVRFYLKYIDKALPKIELNEFAFKSLALLPSWDTIMGLQFENLILHNRKAIKDYLELAPDAIITDNPFFQRKSSRGPGCQIDYLIQTRYQGLYICEIKFSKDPIGTEIIPQMQQKIERLIYPKHYSIRPVLVHVHGVTQELAQSGFFSKIIDFGALLHTR